MRHTLAVVWLALVVATAPVSVVAQQDVGDVFDQFFRFTGPRPTPQLGTSAAPAELLPGETIDLFSGVLRILREDVFLPGKGGHDLRIIRLYSSKLWGRADLLDEEPFLAEKDRSVLGYGWTIHMGRLRDPNAIADPLSTCGGAYPVFEMPDGTTQVFYPSASGVSLSRDYWRLELNCSPAGGAAACIWSPDGVRYEFSGSMTDQFFTGTIPVWPVTKIVDSSGNTITIEYLSQSGAISSVTDTYARRVEFSYSADVDGLRLEHLAVTDGDGVVRQQRNYLYERRQASGAGEGQFPLPAPRRFLREAVPPEGPAETYEYGHDRTVDRNQYALSVLGVPGGATVAYEYTAISFFTGRAVVPFSVVSSRTVAGRGIDSGTWTYSFESPAYAAYSASDPATGEPTDMHVTTVVRPDGLVDTATFYGFGWIADRNDSGYTYLAGLPYEQAKANRTEVKLFGWEPRVDNLLAEVVYAAPLYSDSCGTHFVWDWVVAAPALSGSAVIRDGITMVTEASDFDEYGRPRAVREYALNQKGFRGTQALPPALRETVWTYFTHPAKNIVTGHPLTQVTSVGVDSVANSWTYDDRGLRTSETLRGVPTGFEFDSAGNLWHVTNALNQILTISDYEYGVPRSLDFNGASSVTRTVHWDGRIRTHADGRGHTTTFEYDLAGRLRSVTPPGAALPTMYTYAPDGSWVRESRGSYYLQTELDGLGREASTLDSEGTRTSRRYDNMGRLWFASYPNDGSLELGERSEWDGIGRQTAITRAYIPSTGAYIPSSGTCDDPSTCTVSTAYSSGCAYSTVRRTANDTSPTWTCNWYYGDPDERLLIQLFDADSQLWEYRYNAAGSLEGITAPLASGSRSFVYDTQEHLREAWSPESGSTRFTRNALGQVVSRTDARNVITSFDRTDPLARVVGVAYGSDSADQVTYRYDRANNLEYVASLSGGAFDYVHDELNRMTSARWSLPRSPNGASRTVTYHYDSAGCLDRMTYPSGTVVAMSCDTANRVKTLTVGGQAVVSSVEYYPTGQPHVVSLGNGTVATHTFDWRNRTRGIEVPGVMDLQYEYDGADNVVYFVDYAVPASIRTMTYDKLDRLWSSVAPGLWGSVGYDYDVLGNRRLKSGYITTNYEYDNSNRLKKANGPEQHRSMSFTWSAAGRLASSSDGGSYRYDGHGRRIEKAESGGTTLYHYDAEGRVIAESTTDGTPLREYFYFAGQLVAARGCYSSDPPPCADLYWYHSDTLGNVVARTDSNGAVVARLQYQPWGEQWEPSGDIGARQYNGRVYDPGTGFHDYGARMYWPEIGRFVSADTYAGDIRNPASLNRYSYVHNNPYKYIDPTGHYSVVPSIYGPEGGPLQWGAGWLATKMAAVSLDESQNMAVRAGAAVLGTVASLFDAETTEKTGAVMGMAGSIKINAATGKTFEAKIAGKMEAEGWNVAREVTLETPGGARTRMDIVGTRGDSVRCVECKSSATAPLTPAQEAAHPQIGGQGATVKGAGKPGVPGGTQIPPTKVEIIRPQ